ncbi:MAG: hypothetical protein HY286_10900 [Planctomycetes bacterium]|nr:hypothetical protein [Planctomycetota bacterium]
MSGGGIGPGKIVILLLVIAAAIVGIKYLAPPGPMTPADAGGKFEFEGPRLSETPAPDAFRAVVFGGDFTAGAHLRTNERLRAQLQSLIARNVTNKSVEIVSANIQNRWDAPRPEFIESAIALKPSAVIAVLERAGVETPEEPAAENYTVGTVDWARARDAFAGKIANILASGRGPLSPSAPLPPVEKLEWAAAQCAKNKIPFIIVIIPCIAESDSELRALCLESLAAAPAASRPSIEFAATSSAARALRAAKLTVLDMTPIFREAADVRRMILINYKTGRYNAFASNVVAAQIATHFVSAGMLK